MPKIKPIWSFLASFCLTIFLLLAPWPELEKSYARCFRSMAGMAYGNFGSRGIVRFLATDEPLDTLHDTKIYLGNRDVVKPDGMRPMKVVKISTRYIGYTPSAIVMALVLASPVSLWRRLRAMFWGLLWANLFTGFILCLIILQKYNESEPLHLFQWTGLSRTLLVGAHQVFVVYIGPLFLVPVAIWLVVTFQKDDLGRILSLHQSGTPPPIENS